MQALRHLDLHEDVLPDNGLSIAKSAFAAPREFTQNRLAAVLAGPCRTQAPAAARTTGAMTPMAMGDLKRRADHDLVVRLCRMPPDLAAPLLRSTLPALTPAALLTVLAATGEAHHRLVAARQGLDWRVAKAVIRRGHAAALLALVENTTLTLDDDDQAALATAAENDESLRAALLDRPDLSLAQARLGSSGVAPSHSNLKLLKLMRAGETQAAAAEIARRLMADAGRLGAAFASGSAVPLALATCALGLDRAVFLDLLRHWQGGHNGLPALNAAHRPMVLSVFALEPMEARLRLLATAS